MNRDVRLIVTSVGLSAMGDFVLGVPLALEVRAQTHSTVAVSAFFFAMFGPVVLLGGVAGRVVDRIENRRLLLIVSLLQMVCVLGLLVSDALAAILTLTALTGAGLAFAAPAEFSLLPVAADDIKAANGWVESARYGGMTVGPVLGGVLGAAGLVDLAIVLNAASFAGVALAAALLRARRRPRAVPGDRGRARDGLAPLVKDRMLAITLATAIGALAFFSISMTAELFFVTQTLHGGQAAFGLLLTAWTAGMVVGAVVLSKRLAVTAVAALAAVALQGAGLLGASLAPTVLVAMAGFLFGGVAHGVKNVLLRTVIHERVPEHLRGRAFAGYNAARNGAELTALALAGALVGVLGPRTALALSGAVPLALGLAALALANARAAGSTIDPRRISDARIQG